MISAQVFVPYFAAEYPAGTYVLRVRDNVTLAGYDVPVTVAAGTYHVRGLASFNGLGYTLAQALAAYATAYPATFGAAFGTWAYVTTGSVASTGLAGYLQASKVSCHQFELIGYASTFDVTWLGLAFDTPSTSTGSGSAQRLAFSSFPAGTWFPQVRANDLGMLPSPAQVSYSAMTANGSTAVVDMSGDPSLLPKWWVLYLDGTLGVHGARMQRYRCSKPSWAASIGVATDAPYCPLDYPGGWWSLCVRGTTFAVVDQSVDGQYVAPLRIHAGAECPEGMDPIRGLRSPTVNKVTNAAGRRDLRLAFLYVE